MIVIPISGKYGPSVLVSWEDADMVARWKWSAHKSGSRIYAKRNKGMPDGSRKYVFLHREIMNAPDGMVVDHIDGNTFNNTRENLRVCSSSINNLNKHRAQTNSKSGVLGVFFRKDTGKWTSQITINGKVKTLGSFSKKEDAISANIAARRSVLNA